MASIMEGPLSKWTNVMKGWQYRWFVLDYNAGLLSYYTSKDKMMRGSRRGCVRLQGAVIGIDDEDDSTFTITVDQKTFHFQARDADEREKWIHALEGTILRHTLQLREAETEFVPSVQDFDKKLAEADAYLQILIDQLKLFDEKIGNCKEDEQRRGMVESVKHCIVLLQIAKSTINPVDGIYQPSPLDSSVICTMPTQTVLPPVPPMIRSHSVPLMANGMVSCMQSGHRGNYRGFLQMQDVRRQESNLFIDTKKMSTIKKKVRKLEDQLEYESRSLWKDVTVNLKLRDIDAATEAKHSLEEKQRAEARERKEKEMQWETRVDVFVSL
ncbi:UNVERIFIED_CONTAM: hypothetical protein FKN15_026779 [Acipenser sinensis]